MKTIISIEGADGSGKSTLCRHLLAECKNRGWTAQVIGRTDEDALPLVAKITKLSKELTSEGNSYPVEADFHLRIAREYIRAESCRRAVSQVVILDRFVLSVLSRMRVDAPSGAARYIDHLKDVVRHAGLAATIYCKCPFETAYQRLISDVEGGRRGSLSPKEQRGKDYLQSLHEAMALDFEALTWIGTKRDIATDSGLTEMSAHCAMFFNDGLFT